MSNQEDKFDFSDFEDLGSKIQKTIDTATAEVLKLAGNVKEEALKQVDKAKEEASRQMDKAKEEASRQMDKARESATRQFDKAKEGAARQFDRFYGGQNEQAYVDVGHGRRVISGKLRKNPGLYSGPAEIAIGVAGLAGFGGAGIGLGVTTLVGAMATNLAIASAAIFVPFAVISAVLFGKGIFSSSRARRVKQYSQIWMGKQYVMIDDIESKVRWNRKKIMKDLHYLTKKDLIIGAQLDEGETCLLLTDESKSQYENAMNAKRVREEEEERKRALEEAMENASFEQKEIYRIKKEGQDYLKQLADIKAQIKSLDVVVKISHMEVLAARIFVYASEHLESISRTDKLFKYYFPSVMKLLNVYEDMEKQPIQGENIQKSKREIEESLDTINQALEKLFDEMFQNVAMDISSDIQVLEVMLKQDGLTEDELHADKTEPMLKF